MNENFKAKSARKNFQIIFSGSSSRYYAKSSVTPTDKNDENKKRFDGKEKSIEILQFKFLSRRHNRTQLYHSNEFSSFSIFSLIEKKRIQKDMQ